MLTGLNDEHFGVSAVASGAQDYLVKGRVDPEMLRRAVVYAIERKRAELTAVDLHASRLRAQENARLERGLLPSPLLLDDPGVDIVTRYRPSRQNALLGGDFYDVVQTPDRTVHVMIGDVAGHGPDEAALGVALRIGWRALTFAGLRGNERMRQLERILSTERAEQRHLRDAVEPGARPGQRALHRRAGGSSRHVGARPRHASTGWNRPRSRARPGRRGVAGQPAANCPRVTACCCSPTACSRATPAAATNDSAKTGCSSWLARSRRCPGPSSSTR